VGCSPAEDGVPEELGRIISECLAHEPRERPSARQVYDRLQALAPPPRSPNPVAQATPRRTPPTRLLGMPGDGSAAPQPTPLALPNAFFPTRNATGVSAAIAASARAGRPGATPGPPDPVATAGPSQEPTGTAPPPASGPQRKRTSTSPFASGVLGLPPGATAPDGNPPLHVAVTPRYGSEDDSNSLMHQADPSASSRGSSAASCDQQEHEQRERASEQLGVGQMAFERAAQMPLDAQSHGQGGISQPKSVPSLMKGALRGTELGRDQGARVQGLSSGRGVLSDDSESSVAAAFL
jgi:hypothetical protein